MKVAHNTSNVQEITRRTKEFLECLGNAIYECESDNEMIDEALRGGRG